MAPCRIRRRPGGRTPSCGVRAGPRNATGSCAPTFRRKGTAPYRSKSAANARPPAGSNVFLEQPSSAPRAPYAPQCGYAPTQSPAFRQVKGGVVVCESAALRRRDHLSTSRAGALVPTPTPVHGPREAVAVDSDNRIPASVVTGRSIGVAWTFSPQCDRDDDGRRQAPAAKSLAGRRRRYVQAECGIGGRGGGRGTAGRDREPDDALSEAHAGKPNLRRADRFFATTNRLRSGVSIICSPQPRRSASRTSSRRATPG